MNFYGLLHCRSPSSNGDSYELVVDVTSGSVEAKKTFVASSVAGDGSSPDSSYAHASGWGGQSVPFAVPWNGAAPWAATLAIRIYIDIASTGQCAYPMTGLIDNLFLYF